MAKPVHVIVAGDYNVGKTCLLISYTLKEFPTEYIPSTFESCYPVDNILVDGTEVLLRIYDQEHADRLRLIQYTMADIILLCFSVEKPDSFANVESYWFPEIRRHTQRAAVILVACKIDLRSGDPNAKRTADGDPLITYDDWLALAKNLGTKYCEISAMKDLWVKALFDEAARAGLYALKSPELKSRILRREIPPPPACPPSDPVPEVEISPSTFGDDWLKVLKCPKHADVTFVLEGSHKIDAHKIILSSASMLFERIFRVSASALHNGQLLTDNEYGIQNLNTGAAPGIAKISTIGDTKMGVTTIEISPDIDATVFEHMLEFLYSGLPNLPEPDAIDMEFIHELGRVAGIFKLHHLENICDNILNVQDYLNPSYWLIPELRNLF